MLLPNRQNRMIIGLGVTRPLQKSRSKHAWPKSTNGQTPSVSYDYKNSGQRITDQHIERKQSAPLVHEPSRTRTRTEQVLLQYNVNRLQIFCKCLFLLPIIAHARKMSTRGLLVTQSNLSICLEYCNISCQHDADQLGLPEILWMFFS